MRKLFTAAVLLSLFLTGATQAQQQVQITVENLQPSDGFYFTPVWMSAHDGSFDYFDNGSTASASLEALAEGGAVGGLDADFMASGAGQSGILTSPGGFAGAPVFDPGESASMTFGLSASERYFSFGTMIIPSNDSFFGNDNAMAYELLDANGNFVGNQTLEFSLADLWDAGTEVNDGQGAAFSANGGTSTDENGVVTLGPDLSNFDLTDTADGTTISFASASSSPVLRISITAVPEPTTISVLGLAAAGLVMRRRRK